MNRKIFLFVALLLIVSLACTLSGGTSSSGGEQVAEAYYPRIAVSPFSAEPGSDFQVEFMDFPPNAELEVSLIYFDTSQEIDKFYVQVDGSGYGSMYYYSTKDMPCCSYFFEATTSGVQGVTSGQMVVASAEDDYQGGGSSGQGQDQGQGQGQGQDYPPGLTVYPPSGQAGTRHDLIMAGFPENADLVVQIFDPDGYLLFDFSVPTDSVGNASAWFESGTGYTTGDYLVEASGPGGAFANFTIHITGGSGQQGGGEQGGGGQQDTGSTPDYTELTAVMNSLILNLNVYWSLNFSRLWPEYSSAYFVPEVYAYEPPVTLPGCYLDANKTYNNAFYCSSVQSVYYDQVWLLQKYEEYGVTFLAFIVAHEWGHAAQDVLGVFDQANWSINVELQADCFTGAYFAWGEEKGYYNLADISYVAYTIIPEELAETHWTWTGETAHGGGLRIGVFGEGYANGLDYCKDFEAYVP